MSHSSRFTFLMNHAPLPAPKRRGSQDWLIDQTKYLDQNEIEKLREFAAERLRRGLESRRFALVRDWFLIEMGLQTGLRVSEITALRHGDTLLSGTKSSLKVLGKGHKKRLVWISLGFKDTLERYCQFKQHFGFSTGPEVYVLNNRKNERISKRSLQRTFARMTGEAGLSRCYSIHCLRHTYATWLLRSTNNNYRFVQRQLGHASIKTTQVYAGVIESEARLGLEQLYRTKTR